MEEDIKELHRLAIVLISFFFFFCFLPKTFQWKIFVFYKFTLKICSLIKPNLLVLSILAKKRKKEKNMWLGGRRWKNCFSKCFQFVSILVCLSFLQKEEKKEIMITEFIIHHCSHFFFRQGLGLSRKISKFTWSSIRLKNIITLFKSKVKVSTISK